jgi:trk system potassium uptake protein TrkH
MRSNEQVAALTYAVRIPVVLKYSGQLCLAFGITLIVPIAVAAAWNDTGAMIAYTVSASILGAAGALLARLPAPVRLHRHEALVITALAFLAIPAAMAVPLAVDGIDLGDAFFEAVSAITTTGLTTVHGLENRPPTFLFTRAWLQWIGGLGILVLSLALLTASGSVAHRLARTGVEQAGLLGSARLYARRVATVYLLLTLMAIAVLGLSGADWYQALLHVLAGVSTGGFAPSDQSMADLGSWPLEATLMLSCLAGAVSLALYHPAYRKGVAGILTHPEVRGLLGLALLASLLLTLTMLASNATDWRQVLANGPLVAVSAQTGAGFTSLPLDQLDPASKLVLIGFMLIGGGTGSTAGGIRILRLLILLRLLQLVVRRACMPERAVVVPRVGGHRLEADEIERALLVILLFLGVIVLSWLPFLLMGYPPLDALFEIVSAVATVGLSSGITGSDLDPLLKGVLALDMLLGRLEVIALVLLFYPRTWIGKRMD